MIAYTTFKRRAQLCIKKKNAGAPLYLENGFSANMRCPFDLFFEVGSALKINCDDKRQKRLIITDST